MMKYHPDVTKEKFDTTTLCRNIILAWQDFQSNYNYKLQRVVVKESPMTETERYNNSVRPVENIYVTVYRAIASFDKNTMQKIYKLTCIKCYVAKNVTNADDMIETFKKMKHFKEKGMDILSDNVFYDKRDRDGFVLRIETLTEKMLNDIMHSEIVKEEQRWRQKNVCL